MNKPKIDITDALRIAISFSNTEKDEPFCTSAIYEGSYYVLTLYTHFQKYEFYIHGFSGKVAGVNSEPILSTPAEYPFNHSCNSKV